MKFLYNKNSDLPALAWLAVFTKGSDFVEINCGDAVVTTEDWFVAGVWDGELCKGEMDTCTTSCCTGLKTNLQGGVNLFTPTHMQETVFAIRVDSKLYISNSLTFALVASCSKLQTTYKQYVADMGSILYGLCSEKTVKFSPLENGRRLLYLRCCIAEIDKELNIKETIRRSGLLFKDFTDYKQKILEVLKAIKQNATDTMRKKPYGMVGTISRGYDAPSACVIAKEIGCDEVFTFVDRPDDDGTELAKILGYRDIYRVDSKAYKHNEKYLEAEALASGEGGATFIAFEDLFRGKLLFIGNRGDSVYERLHENENDNLDFHVGNRLSQASLTIYENMLYNNSITISIPLIGGDRWTDLKRISNSEDMKMYSVNEEYDRPIARRLLEEAGVKREMFGQRKYGAGISYSLDTLGRIRQKMSVKSYAKLEEYKKCFPKRIFADFAYYIKFYWVNRSEYINYICNRLHIKHYIKNTDERVGMLSNPLSTMMLCWGVEMMKKRYKI